MWHWHQKARYKHGKRSRGRPEKMSGWIKEGLDSLNMTIQETTRTEQDRTIRRRILKELSLRDSRASPRQ